VEATETNQFRPFFQMWIKPKDTMERIFAGETRKENGMIKRLAMLAGIAEILTRFHVQDAGNDYSLTTIILIALFFGPILGIFLLYIMGWLVQFTGKWIGGIEERSEIRKAIAWANIPIAWSLIVWCIAIILFGREYFMGDIAAIEFSSFKINMYYILLFIDIIIYCWFIYIIVKCLAVAQKFSAWKSLLNLILASLLPMTPIILLIII
jgi:hypothetical protein